MEDQDVYYEIAKAGEGQLREKMSRFLAFALKIRDAEEARALVKEYQNAYHDSRHVCWAYMLGPAMEEYQLNDNGEPSGTAGKPILGQIRSHGVTNVLVVVVRYFGGIKLGTSGLIAAYRSAADLALADAGRREMHEMRRMLVSVPYITLDSVMRIVKEEGLEVLDQQFDNVCSLTLAVRASRAGEIAGRMGKTEGIHLEMTE